MRADTQNIEYTEQEIGSFYYISVLRLKDKVIENVTSVLV